MIKLYTASNGHNAYLLNAAETAYLLTYAPDEDPPSPPPPGSEPPPPPPEAIDVILDYDHVSQNGPTGNKNRNDCGAAAACSIIRQRGYPKATVDEIAVKFQRQNKPMTIAEVVQSLRGFSIVANSFRATSALITEEILSGSPAIALVSYPSLPFKAIPYGGSHYILCYGVMSNGDVLYHDPLADGSTTLRITPAQLDAALKQVVRDGNTANLGIKVD